MSQGVGEIFCLPKTAWPPTWGIAPDVRVPITYPLVKAQYQDGDDVIMQYAVSYLDSLIQTKNATSSEEIEKSEKN